MTSTSTVENDQLKQGHCHTATWSVYRGLYWDEWILDHMWNTFLVAIYCSRSQILEGTLLVLVWCLQGLTDRDYNWTCIALQTFRTQANKLTTNIRSITVVLEALLVSSENVSKYLQMLYSKQYYIRTSLHDSVQDKHEINEDIPYIKKSIYLWKCDNLSTRIPNRFKSREVIMIICVSKLDRSSFPYHYFLGTVYTYSTMGTRHWCQNNSWLYV